MRVAKKAILFAGLALLLNGCASSSDAPTTIRTRGDNDPAILEFANQRFSGEHGFCLWAEYYRVYKLGQTCGTILTTEEQQNYHLVMGAIERSIATNSRGSEVAMLRIRQSKAQLDQSYDNATADERLAACGEQPDLMARLVQNYLSKRVSDIILRQTEVKGDPFPLFCSP